MGSGWRRTGDGMADVLEEADTELGGTRRHQGKWESRTRTCGGEGSNSGCRETLTLGLGKVDGLKPCLPKPAVGGGQQGPVESSRGGNERRGSTAVFFCHSEVEAAGCAKPRRKTATVAMRWISNR